VPSPLPFYLAVILGRYFNKKKLAPLPREAQHVSEEESSSSMQNIMSIANYKKRRFPVETPRKQSNERVRKYVSLSSTTTDHLKS